MDTSPDPRHQQHGGADELSRETGAIGVVHDLRMPLGVISGYADLLDSGNLGALPERARRAVEAIVVKTSEMQALLNGLLDATRADPPATLETRARGLDLAGEARAAHARALPRARLGGHAVAVLGDGNVPVLSEPRLLRRIIDNLVNNAMSHGRDGDGVHVTLATSRRDGFGVIRIEDDGRGLSPTVRRRLFSPQVPLASAPHRAGLGLAVSFALAERIGASLEFDDSYHSGAAFVLSLPLAG